MQIPQLDEIIEQNDQTEARLEHLEKLRELVGNAYPNKFERSSISGSEDTITALLKHPPIAGIAAEMGEIVATLGEGERPPAEIKDELNARLRELGNVRIAGRMAVQVGASSLEKEREGLALEVIVVDNASTDETVALVEQRFELTEADREWALRRSRPVTRST